MSATTSMSFAEFEQLPDMPGKQELIEGELIAVPPPKHTHSVVIKNLSDLLRTILDRSRVWSEAGYRIGGGWLQPDVSVSWPDQKITDGYLSGSPMLAAEVVSDNNTAADILRKVKLYLEHGSEEVWILDPKHRSMTVYQRNKPTVFAERQYHSEPLGLTVDLAELFRQ